MDLSAYVNQSLTFVIGYICQNPKHLQLYYTIFTVKIKENTYEWVFRHVHKKYSGCRKV